MRVDGWLPQRRVTRLVLIIAGAVLLAAALAAVPLRHYAADSPVALGLVAGTHYLLLAAPVGLVLMLLARQWIGVAAGVLVLALVVSTQVWLYTSDDPPKDAVTLHVMTSNLRLGQADPKSVVAAVRRHGVDILMLEELTAEEQAALHTAGLDDLLPHHASDPEGAGIGTGLWSRYPLSDVTFPQQFTFVFVSAHVRVPGVAQPLRAVALHAAGPVPEASSWTIDIGRFPATLRGLAGAGPMLVGGDFNATPDHVQFRKVLDAGFRDAADQAGAGYTRTFPANTWYPPLIAIDHVLTRGGPVATDVRTIQIAGTDHRALLVDVAVPRS